jgi:hypothetical protein
MTCQVLRTRKSLKARSSAIDACVSAVALFEMRDIKSGRIEGL